MILRADKEGINNALSSIYGPSTTVDFETPNGTTQANAAFGKDASWF
jgi:hypothetical protein